MGIIDRFLKLFYHRKLRTHTRRNLAGSSFRFKEVKMMVLSKEEAEKRTKELIDLLLFVHRNTNFAVCNVDDKVLGLIRTLLFEQKGEEKDIQEKKLELYRKYAEELHDRIMEYADWNEDTYIDFKEASEVLKRAERVMQSTQVSIIDMENIIGEMKLNLDKMEDKKNGYEVEGFRKFFRLIFSLWGIEAILLGGIIGAYAGSLISTILLTLAGFYFVAYPTWYIFKLFYKRCWIIGKEKLFKEHDYFEPSEV